MATIQERIASIEAILDRGLSKVVDQDGRTHEYDLEALRKQLDTLVRTAKGGLRVRHGIYNPAFKE